MADPRPCPVCSEPPAVNRSRRATNGPESFSLECKSGKHPMLIVKTHPCGDEDSAVAVWNGEA